MKILVIGGNGFIGLHLVKQFISLGYDTTILSNNTKIKFKSNKKIKLVKGDITNFNDVKKHIKNKDIIINLAAIINKGTKSDINLDWKINCKGQLNILEACKQINKNARIIFFGSRDQFGRINKKIKIKENYPQNPITIYGIHKQTAENYCKFYAKSFNLQTTIVRPSSVYGPALNKEENKNVINLFIKKALKNQTLTIINKGKDYKSFIYIEDLVDAITLIIKKNITYDLFNIAPPKCIKFIDICNIIIKQCNNGKIEYKTMNKNELIYDAKNTCMNTNHIKKKIGWKPKVSIEEGIKRTIKFYNQLEGKK